MTIRICLDFNSIKLARFKVIISRIAFVYLFLSIAIFFLKFFSTCILNDISFLLITKSQMWNSNQWSDKNVSSLDQATSSKQHELNHEKLSYNHKGMCKLFNNKIKEHSYAKMVIEVFIK